MGAGVSTEGAPLTRVKCKNKLGVLFDPEAEEKFYATATGPKGEETVPWPEAAAYVKTRDERWRDPKHVLFQNLKQFRVARRYPIDAKLKKEHLVNQSSSAVCSAMRPCAFSDFDESVSICSIK